MVNPANADVLLRYHFLTPPEAVFDAWLKPELIRKWLFVGPASEIVSVELDPTEKGKFSIVELDKQTNTRIDHHGEYIVIYRPHELMFRLFVPEKFPGESVVNVKIKTDGKGCELTLTQTAEATGITEASWKKMLEQLKLSLEIW